MTEIVKSDDLYVSATTLKTQLDSEKEKLNRFSLELSSYSIIESDEKRQQANKVLSEANKAVKKIHEIRLGYTRKIDEHKAMILEIEREYLSSITDSIESVKKACDKFVKDEHIRQLHKRKEIEEQRKSAISYIEGSEKKDLEILEAHFTAQAQLQALPTLSGIRKKYVAVKDPGTRYDEIVAFYMENGGDEAALKFLLEFLVKKGCPDIYGVTYVEQPSNIAR